MRGREGGPLSLRSGRRGRRTASRRWRRCRRRVGRRSGLRRRLAWRASRGSGMPAATAGGWLLVGSPGVGAAVSRRVAGGGGGGRGCASVFFSAVLSVVGWVGWRVGWRGWARCRDGWRAGEVKKQDAAGLLGLPWGGGCSFGTWRYRAPSGCCGVDSDSLVGMACMGAGFWVTGNAGPFCLFPYLRCFLKA